MTREGSNTSIRDVGSACISRIAKHTSDELPQGILQQNAKSNSKVTEYLDSKHFALFIRRWNPPRRYIHPRALAHMRISPS